MVLKKVNLFNGIMTGFKGEINGTHIREATASVEFHFAPGAEVAYSCKRIWEYLHLEDENVKYNDFRVPYSYYRIEVDPYKTSCASGYSIEDIGTDHDKDYFTSNCYVHLDGTPDFISVDMGVGCESINKLKIVCNDFFAVRLNKPNGSKPLKVVIEFSIFYFYIPSKYSKCSDSNSDKKDDCCDDNKHHHDNCDDNHHNHPHPHHNHHYHSHHDNCHSHSHCNYNRPMCNNNSCSKCNDDNHC